jgi:ATP-dependent helicase/nuclease subunit A
VKLAQGKLFIVGDPKQSIYAFRRADIEAYLHVVQKMIARQNGVEYQLKTNFRSHKGILDVVNGLFEKLIVPRAGLQPSYAAIHPAEDDPLSARTMPFRKVALRRVDSAEPVSAEGARRLEAENLARWLDEEVIGRATILNRDQKPVIVQARDVALLLRKLTDIHLYLEPLRRRGIPYVVEGERHFYATQEIIDAVNLLRAVANPYDRAALVGVLRSAVGGLTDREIYELHAENRLDYRGNAANLKPSVRDLYAALSELHAQTRELPVGEAVHLVFSQIPIQILAARSFNGEQAVANLEKVRQLAGRMGREGAATLREVIARLHRSILDVKEEGESALAEVSVDAVHILSVHKAKGLEFPIVVLPGCHSPVDSREPRVGVQHEWSSNLVGLNVAERWSLSGVYLAEKSRRRSAEEHKRVFYVAMTRAREHLALSSGPEKKHNSGSFLGMLENVRGDSLVGNGARPIPIGEGRIESEIIVEKLAPPKKRIKRQTDAYPPIDWAAYANFWRQREESLTAVLNAGVFINPTALKFKEQHRVERFAGKEPPVSPDYALLIGRLAHGFLESWDFSLPIESLDPKLAEFVARVPDRQFGAEYGLILSALQEIFTPFFCSPIYAELCSVRIVAREAPFVMPWKGQVMEGVIDLIYQKDGRLFLVDYKTDRIASENVSGKAREYDDQARIYSQAVRECLGREPAGFRLIFLRLGQAVDVVLNQGALQYTLPLS